jgi:hypothetical protein
MLADILSGLEAIKDECTQSYPPLTLKSICSADEFKRLKGTIREHEKRIVMSCGITPEQLKSENGTRPLR